MSRFYNFIEKTASNIKVTTFRFPPVFIFFPFITVLISLLIENNFTDNRQTLVRLIFSALIGALFSISVQFTCERFNRLMKFKWYLHGSSFILTVLYYFLLTSSGKTEGFTLIRLFVISFALFAFYLWVPAFKDRKSFPASALVHFKSFFISALYSLVLTLGIMAIYFAIDLLLVKLNVKIPGHIFNFFGTFFFPVYYLSLLPNFNSEEKSMVQKYETAARYPQFLEILVSYIAVPLITAFTVVLAVYFVKIIITLKWPVGELGPMILGYSAVGLIIYVLAGRLENRFASFYRRYFPVALIPLVCLQLYSVFIRINAYGFTESRYYLVLFGIYSIVCAIFLIRMKGTGHAIIALLAACFAIFSIIPPVDAFTVSRASQSSRVLTILKHNNMLSDSKIIPNSKIPEKDKSELTNIMGYLFRMGHTANIGWLPADYDQYRDFQKVFGFSEFYPINPPVNNGISYFNANIDIDKQLDISGYSTMLRIPFFSNTGSKVEDRIFIIGSENYTLKTTTPAKDDVVFTILDSKGNELVTASLGSFLNKLVKEGQLSQKNLYPPSSLTFDSTGASLRVRVIIQNVNFRRMDNDAIDDINGEALVLVGKR